MKLLRLKVDETIYDEVLAKHNNRPSEIKGGSIHSVTRSYFSGNGRRY